MASFDALALLTSIDATLKAILNTLLLLNEGQQDKPTGVALDADLDGPHGDPEIRAKSPRDWVGESQQGKRFSQCPPEYLDLVAARLDYFAEQNAASDDPEQQKKAGYNRKDAARARGWAARIRAGYVPVNNEPSITW